MTSDLFYGENFVLIARFKVKNKNKKCQQQGYIYIYIYTRAIIPWSSEAAKFGCNLGGFFFFAKIK